MSSTAFHNPPTDGTTSPRPRIAIWQTEPCPPWCIRQHHDWERDDDREHAGAARSTPLRLMPPVELADSTWSIDEMHVYLAQHIEAAVPSLVLNQGEHDGPRFTLSEAADLANSLLAALAEVGYGTVTTAVIVSQGRAA